jgi:hypothetical protein
MCEDKDVGRKLETLHDEVIEAIDLGIDAEHRRSDPNMAMNLFIEEEMENVY